MCEHQWMCTCCVCCAVGCSASASLLHHPLDVMKVEVRERANSHTAALVLQNVRDLRAGSTALLRQALTKLVQQLRNGVGDAQAPFLRLHGELAHC